MKMWEENGLLYNLHILFMLMSSGRAYWKIICLFWYQRLFPPFLLDHCMPVNFPKGEIRDSDHQSWWQEPFRAILAAHSSVPILVHCLKQQHHMLRCDIPITNSVGSPYLPIWSRDSFLHLFFRMHLFWTHHSPWIDHWDLWNLGTSYAGFPLLRAEWRGQ